MISTNGRTLKMAAFLAAVCFEAECFTVPIIRVSRKVASCGTRHANKAIRYMSPSERPEPVLKKAPVLNGKMLLPFKVMVAGLKGHEVAAVYAVKNSDYKRGSGDGWQNCEHVGLTRNLEATLQSHAEQHGPDVVAHVRALSFAYPQERAMEEVASQWRKLAKDAGGKVGDTEKTWTDDWGTMVGERREELLELLDKNLLFDDDDDDDEFELDDDDISVRDVIQSLGKTPAPNGANTVVSPFEASSEGSSSPRSTLEFTKENVDKVLEEVRPYLISDGGNVAVERVDEATRNVYLILEGACGSCPSSTVTMQMGIERILKENFADLGEVLQVEDQATSESTPTELTWAAVENEMNRIKPAIIAMGGAMAIQGVDPIGVVEVKFQGSNKVRQGVELALLDVPFVKHVKFVMWQ